MPVEGRATGEGRAIGRTRTDSAIAVVIVVGVVAVTWIAVVVGLVSFGPGSATLAIALLGVSVIGWVTTPYLPLPRLARWVGIGVTVVGSILLGVIVANDTPPRGDEVQRELEAIAAHFIDWDGQPSTVRPLAPWEAPVATIYGEVRTGGSERSLDVVESELVEQGFSVVVLREAGDGLSFMDESRGPTTDLFASRDHWEVRAALDGRRISIRLGWTPLVTTIDPYGGDGGGTGLLGAIGGFASGLVLHWAAAIVAFVGVLFTFVSAGLGVAALVGWLSRRRDRTSMAGGGADPDRSVPPDP